MPLHHPPSMVEKLKQAKRELENNAPSYSVTKAIELIGAVIAELEQKEKRAKSKRNAG